MFCVSVCMCEYVFCNNLRSINCPYFYSKGTIYCLVTKNALSSIGITAMSSNARFLHYPSNMNKTRKEEQLQHKMKVIHYCTVSPWSWWKLLKASSLDGGIMSKDLHNIEFFTVISTTLKTHSNCPVWLTYCTP